jgi:hypothetical protein
VSRDGENDRSRVRRGKDNKEIERGKRERVADRQKDREGERGAWRRK